MRFKLMVLLLVVMLVQGLLATTQLRAESDENLPVILILGDSISAAYNMEIGQSWPSLLQDRLKQDGYAYQVFNSSIVGETTQGGITRLPRLLEKRQPDFVLIELGGNDGLRGLPIEETQKNFSSMIEISQQSGAQVILSEMRIPPNYGRSYTEKFNQTYSTLQKKYGITLLPFILQDIALEPGMMQADGIHPSIAAQPVILDKVWAVLSELL
jgi:acyl-CoA thioesterase-1